MAYGFYFSFNFSLLVSITYLFIHSFLHSPHPYLSSPYSTILAPYLMESLHHDPLTKQPYDLTVHVPHIVPCCGETCAITTIHHAKSTTNKCPFCAEALPEAGWLVNKLICRMLSEQAQLKAPDHDSKSLPRLKNPCSAHLDQTPP